ncbi:MAG: F0F1 ATP synthase subunit A [Dehalococcoidales bacterium]|nr:F0F1 ATP synthase subunit A [Dehalococcoidales bacterium]
MSGQGRRKIFSPLFIGIILVFLFLAVIGFISGPLGSSILSKFGLELNLPFGLAKPEPHLPAALVFEIFGFPVTNSLIASWITIIVLVGVSYLITRRMKPVPGRLQGAFELLLGWLYNFCQSVAGEHNGRRFFPVVATIFLYVAFNAWLSLLPGFGSIEILNPEGHHVELLRGANTDINTPLAIALVSFVFVEFFGLRILGIRYLGKFINVGPLFRSIGQVFKGKVREGLNGLLTGVIFAVVGVLETLSEFVRIVSFTLRLFGNMTAGEILLLIAAFLVPWVFAPIFYGLEVFVGFVQALIFGGLTLVFLTLATAHHSE